MLATNELQNALPELDGKLLDFGAPSIVVAELVNWTFVANLLSSEMSGKLEAAGAKVVSELPQEHQETCIVVCQSRRDRLYRQAVNRKFHVRSPFFVADMLKSIAQNVQELTLDTQQLLWFPLLQLKLKVQHSVCVSNYVGKARECIKLMVQACGWEYSSTLE